MKLLAITLVASLVVACGQAAPPVAGDMSEVSVCQTAGYLIRQRLGDAFKTARVPCSVKNVGGDRVEIRAGYVSPLGPTLHYTAHGQVRGDRLRINTIAVDGVDDKPIDFAGFPH